MSANSLPLVGHLDAGLGQAIEWLVAAEIGLKYVLITMMDSESDLTRVNVLREASATGVVQFIEGAALTSPSIVEQLATLGTFTGFDECWFFRSKTSIVRRPPAFLVSPLDLSVDREPAGISEWMLEANCVVGLGDGDGLNYVCQDRAVATVLSDRVGQ